MINLSAGSPGFNSCQSYHYPIRDNDGQYCASNTISSVYPETLLIYALNDPYPDDIFNHAENNKLLSERGVYTLPVTSFLLATNPPVRPMNIEILEQALAHPQIGLTQFDIDELKKIQCSNQTVKHQDLCLLKKHSQWGKIVTLKEKFIADLESHCLNDCKRIIIFLHGNMNDDDSFTTSCFGTCPSAFEKRLFICQNIETLSDAISTLFNSFCSIFGGNKVVDVEFATCSDFESEKLYRNFEKHLNILNKDVSVKVFYFSSWRLMIINYDAQNVAGSFLCFSDLDSLYFSAGFNDISGEFSYPFHSCNNQSIGFYKGECDWLVKHEILGYIGQFDVVQDFILSKEKTTSLQVLAEDSSMFSYWDQIKDKPKELSSYLKEKENNPDAVQYFLSLKDVKGRNVISHLATVQRGEFMPGFIDNLVKMGVSPDQYDHDGRSPLYWAVNDGCLANTIQLMVSLKGNSICTTEQLTTMINKPNIRGMPPIGKAIFHGHIEIVSFLLKQKARLGWQDNNGHTPLILACMSGNKAVVNLILSKLEDNQQINQPDKIGLTPLHYAFEKNPDLAPALLARGADLSIKGGENFNTPLITACQKWSDLEQVFNAVSEDNHLEKALHLFNIEGWWPLGVACAENKPALVQQLLKSGSGLETCNLQGNALQIACKAGNLDCLNALLWFIHDPDSLVSLFVTKPLLHLVIDSGSTETPAMINALLLSGSDPLKTDKEGNMAFHHAIINKSEAAFIALIDNEQVKRGINHINTFGETPLHLVSHAGSQDAITRLIKAGADISIRDLDGNTIIHQCAAKGYTDCLELLLMPSEIPAREIVRRLSCKNRLGYTPVDLASVSNSHEAKRFIETVLKKCV